MVGQKYYYNIGCKLLLCFLRGGVQLGPQGVVLPEMMNSDKHNLS